MFVIPILGIIAPMFLLCGAIAPVAGLIKFIGSLFGYDVPYVVAQFGSMTLSPVFTFLYSVVRGGVFWSCQAEEPGNCYYTISVWSVKRRKSWSSEGPAHFFLSCFFLSYFFTFRFPVYDSETI